LRAPSWLPNLPLSCGFGDMADRLYLSYWLNGFTEANMLRHYEKILSLFPFSRLARSASVLRIHAVEYAEPVLAEQAFDSPPEVDLILRSAKQFRHADCAYHLETWWDLWTLDEGDWKLAPAPASIVCFAPDFERDGDEQIRIDCGIDAQFLPDREAPEGLRMSESNIKSLLKLAHDLDNALTSSRRRLWTETGENFAERLQRALEEAE
jgi:hypothetical protein